MLKKKKTERGKQQGEQRGAWWEDRWGAGWTYDATNNYVYKNNFYNTIYKNTTIIIIITVILINIITVFFQAKFCHLYSTLSSADQIQKILSNPIIQKKKQTTLKYLPEAKTKGQKNNLHWREKRSYRHYHHALTFLHLLLIIFKRQQKKIWHITKLSWPVQLLIFIKGCIYILWEEENNNELLWPDWIWSHTFKSRQRMIVQLPFQIRFFCLFYDRKLM